MRGLLRTLERALSLQDMGRCDVSAHSPEKQGPFPSDRSEKAACLGMNWESRWIQYSELGVKKLGMGQILEQAGREQKGQGETTESIPGWQAGAEVGREVRDVAEDVSKTRVREQQRMGGGRFIPQPTWREDGGISSSSGKAVCESAGSGE